MSDDLRPAVNDQIFCSALSLAAGEPLFATASEGETWLLLEYNGAWGTKAFEESDLPPAVKTRLNVDLKTLSGARLLLLKSRPGVLERGLSFFLARTCEDEPRLYEFKLDSYTDLLDLDIPGMVSGRAEYETFRRREPLFVICTNGRRDACCAKFGFPTYVELMKTAGDSIWQSTHQGGHRYAPNLICFPHGLYNGRVDPEGGAALIAAYRRGEIYPEHLRGRACYPKPVQAADTYLRRKTGDLGVDAFRLLSSQREEDEIWTVKFIRTREPGEIHRLVIRREVTDQLLYSGCGLDKVKPLIRYHLEDYLVIDPESTGEQETA